MQRLSLVAVALTMLGCRQNPTLVVPPSFERPGAMAFFCYDTETRAAVPIAECDGLQGVTTETKALTALVAQTARGEIASVDLRLDRVIDADIRVPGFTFVQVGEVPSAIVVPPNQPSVTYVASFGSRRIEYYPTSDFREDIDAVGSSGRGEIPLSDGPIDLVLTEAEDALITALPERGQLAVMAVQADLSLGEPVTIDLALPDPLPMAVEPPDTIPVYERFCPTTLEVRSPRAGLGESVEADPLLGSQPSRLFVDGDVLLVTDAAQPVIHRFAIEGTTLTPMEPLMPGARIRELALTPVVPALPGGDLTTEPARFLYAIDADEGSVLVMDYLDTSTTFGAVLPVHVGEGRWDRIRLAGRARSIDIMTPGFPETSNCDPSSDVPEERVESLTPTRITGVFAAIGLANGLVEVVDIHDLDMACRGGAGCTNPLQELDERVFIRRHAPRIGAFVTAASQTIGTPTFAFEGAPGRIEVDGSAGGGGPGLAQSAACAPFMDPIFPSDSAENSDEGLDPLICAIVEPWSARAERWDTSWEGPIPGAVSGAASLNPTELRIEIPGHNLCARGVLGRNDITASMLTGEDPESLYTGDQVFITTDPPEFDGELAFQDCERFVADVDGVRDEVGLVILEANDESLLVDDPEGVLACFRDPTTGASSLFGMEVRVNDAFAVVGAASRFVHRVVANEEGNCRIDREGQPWVVDDPSTHLNARAFNDVPYTNPYVGFTINNAGGLRNETAVLTFAVGTIPPALVVDVGIRGRGRLSTIIDGMRYSDTDERLYVIDSNIDSFVQVELDPFQREQTFE